MPAEAAVAVVATITMTTTTTLRLRIPRWMKSLTSRGSRVWTLWLTLWRKCTFCQRNSDCSEKNEREAGVFRFGKLRSLADLLWRGGGRRARGRGRVCDEAHRRPEYVAYGVEHLGAEKQTRERERERERETREKIKKVKKVTLRTCF